MNLWNHVEIKPEVKSVLRNKLLTFYQSSDNYDFHITDRRTYFYWIYLHLQCPDWDRSLCHRRGTNMLPRWCLNNLRLLVLPCSFWTVMIHIQAWERCREILCNSWNSIILKWGPLFVQSQCDADDLKNIYITLCIILCFYPVCLFTFWHSCCMKPHASITVSNLSFIPCPPCHPALTLHTKQKTGHFKNVRISVWELLEVSPMTCGPRAWKQ